VASYLVSADIALDAVPVKQRLRIIVIIK